MVDTAKPLPDPRLPLFSASRALKSGSFLSLVIDEVLGSWENECQYSRNKSLPKLHGLGITQIAVPVA